MSKYDEFLSGKSRSNKKTPTNNRDLLWNLLTVVMILLTLGACGVLGGIFTNPYQAYNPFPPATPIPPTITPTWTPIRMPPTYTPKPTLPPTETRTPRPTWTNEPTATVYVFPTATSLYTATPSETPTRTPKPQGMPYKAEITVYESTKLRADSSCDSMYVVGQTLDFKKNPVLGLQVRLGGSLPGKSFNPALTTLTGIVTTYGPSGFEFDLQIAPVASKESLWLQLYDQSGMPLSDQVFLTTYADCKKNMIYLRFTQK